MGACVGLDPVVERLPIEFAGREDDEAIEHFCLGVIDAVADTVAVVKPQSACFERFGSRGFGALERVCAHARDRGLIVVLDAKRGDIGISAAHYAASASGMGVHAVTVNGYLGASGVRPFLEEDLGTFVLVRTSNPDSDELQARALSDGLSVAETMAETVNRLGAEFTDRSTLSSLGAVVGATKSSEGVSLRGRMPDQIFLVPGYGAQGGSAEDLRTLRNPEKPGGAILVNSSRAVIYADAVDASWQQGVAEAARRFVNDLVSLE